MKVSQELNKLFERDLIKLKEEISSYSNEEDLWLIGGGIKNTAGNLAMHLCGNLQYFVGTILAETGYVRDRDFEFEGKLSRFEIIEEIEQTKSTLASYFATSTFEDYEVDYPLEVFGHRMTTFYFLTHLQGHLNYHLGQVNYHRRILTK